MKLIERTTPIAQGNTRTARATGHDRQFFFSVAMLGAQAADALEHARQNGVIHRDIKPGNLMLDANAQLNITDFGLARMASDVAMTMAGDLIGTLRYMSPEQALAKRVVIDQRSDIYSLRATLYELVALRPAFDGESRQELLKQIAFDEPTRLRSTDRSVPSELETIVHKALAKSPDECYATAEALADDLRSFCQNRPIKAKPPTTMQRASKWAQRHQGLVAAALVVLLITNGTLAGSTWIVSQKQQETKAALADTRVHLEEANRQRKRADENFRPLTWDQEVECGPFSGFLSAAQARRENAGPD